MARKAPSAPATTSLTPGQFSATVTAIASAFGDPTRRQIYLFARDSDHGVTASQVAEEFRVHPNVARHHLDKLAAAGHLEVAIERSAGAGAGRPSKCYRASAEEIELEAPVRTDDLVLALLGRALAALPAETAESLAEQVGIEYGTAMAAALPSSDLAAGQRSLRAAMQSVADALTAHGFAARTERRDNKLRIVNNHCPFGDVAIEHPVLCAVDRGMVKGMMGTLHGSLEPSTAASLAQGDTFCATTFS
ncbi:MAG: helix-turn-helix domain-containing protein [Ilumatobacteraceae bacterium]